MKIARVIGETIATVKSERVRGSKLLILRETDHRGEEMGNPYVALDLVHAGVGELVLTGHGSAARQTFQTKDCPVDAVIMAVIDHLEVDGEVVFRKA